MKDVPIRSSKAANKSSNKGAATSKKYVEVEYYVPPNKGMTIKQVIKLNNQLANLK
jgi:hypothetical protein